MAALQKDYDIRAILNRLKWSEGGLEAADIVYISRGSEDDRATISGRDITAIGRSAIETYSRTIPYHRILTITRLGKVIFRRP